VRIVHQRAEAWRVPGAECADRLQNPGILADYVASAFEFFSRKGLEILLRGIPKRLYAEPPRGFLASLSTVVVVGGRELTFVVLQMMRRSVEESVWARSRSASSWRCG
jgi:hypothetical protein